MTGPRTSPRLLALGVLLVGVGLGLGMTWFFRLGQAPTGPAVQPLPAQTDQPSPREAAVSPAPESTGTVRWLAAGGGDAPESNQVSIEQDLGLAVEVLGPGGVLLYASGPGTRAVQVLSTEHAHTGLRAELADLFSPRPGRDARYRETVLHPSGAASREVFLEALHDAIATAGPPLLVYLAGHGVAGETPADNALLMWGRSELTPADLATALDTRGARHTRLVVTSCYGGGFAETAFVGAVADAPLAPGRCGFFATTSDREAAGCDPDPDRRGQDGYGMHFLHALRGRAADNTALEVGQIDFDGDGKITLYEAHSRVRIASRAVDVPTSTSERWLRRVAPDDGPEREVSLPEEDAVITALTRDLVLPAELAPVRARVAELDAALEAMHVQGTEAADEEQRRFDAVSAALLGRWPILDDPWHPDFADLLAREGGAIEDALRTDPRYRAFLEASADLEHLADERRKIEVKQAPFLRLMRALENRQLAGRLRAEGGEPWRAYERLLECERTTPDLPIPRGSHSAP
ncbi:MAG: hypothetical protein R3F39_19875 [Myxococcota bacterium]